MTTSSWIALLALAIAVGVPYIVWTRIDARRHRRAAVAHAEVLELGDEAVPTSLHPVIDVDRCIGSGACVRACPEHDVIGITDGRARLVNPLGCVGHSACMRACPVGAIKLVFGSATKGVELPLLSVDYETSQQGVYIVGELGGMGLIRNAVAQGRQVADAIARAGRRAPAGEIDVIIVGAGPSGISAALGCIAHGLGVQIVDQSQYGGTIAHYPRAKVVMTGALELPGYGTVRRKTMSKEQLLELWADIRSRTQLDVREAVRVEALARDGDLWRVRGTNYDARAATVVLALGRRGAPRQLGVPGEELPKVSYRLLEPEPFADRHVMVVGGGNAAADCAIALAEAKLCKSVSLSYRKRQLARLRGSVRKRLDELIAEGAVTAHLGTEVVQITTSEIALRDGAAVSTLANDAVIVQIGGTSPSDLLKSLGIELIEKRGVA